MTQLADDSDWKLRTRGLCALELAEVRFHKLVVRIALQHAWSGSSKSHLCGLATNRRCYTGLLAVDMGEGKLLWFA